MYAFRTEFDVTCMQVSEPTACKQANEYTEGSLAKYKKLVIKANLPGEVSTCIKSFRDCPVISVYCSYNIGQTHGLLTKGTNGLQTNVMGCTHES